MKMKTIDGADLTMRRTRIGDYLELTKPRITSLVLITTLVGFYMGSTAGMETLLLLHTMLGTAFVAGGASALNQYLERQNDARMQRTKDRPLPDRRVFETEALLFSGAISVIGVLYLLVFTNILTGLLGAITLGLYVCVYTPLKTRTGWATLVGAVPGAAPPMMGWTAANGELDAMAWVLFGIVFLWQMPHFLAIAWIYDEDYQRGGFAPLTITSTGEGSASRQIIFYCCALLPISLLPTTLGDTGNVYLFGAIALGLIYLAYGMAVAFLRSNTYAVRLLRVSVLYLPALLLLMVVDKVR